MLLFQQDFSVRFRYGVYASRDVFARENRLLHETLGDGGQKQIAFVIDQGIADAQPELLAKIAQYCACHPMLERARPRMVLPGGEAIKNDPQYVQYVHEAIHAYGLCRHSCLVAVGGGALLDTVGFAAATAHRGIRLLRLPTTVLAQCDAGIGVKNGINRFGKKNFVGTFAPPLAVINDSAFLETLDDRDWRAGIAEAVKVALLKDPAFFATIERESAALLERDVPAMERVITRCAQLHLQHIGGDDPFEQGSSRPLDFGHWAAHRLESLTCQALRHGEAVAIGIALDTTYAYLGGLLGPMSWRRILRLLKRLGFRLWVPELTYRDRNDRYGLMSGLDEFREHLGGELSITLLRDIGAPCEVHEIDLSRVEASARYLEHFERGETPWQPNAACAR